MKIIDKDDKIKCAYFSEIRNQFAHNYDAIDYKSCFAFIDMENKLLKFYKNKIKNDLDHESRCHRLFWLLYADIGKITSKLIGSIAKKYYAKGKTDAQVSLLKNLKVTLEEYAKNDSYLYDKMSEIFSVTTEKVKVQLNLPKD